MPYNFYDEKEELAKPIADRKVEYKFELENPIIIEQVTEQLNQGLSSGEVYCDNPLGIPLTDEEIENDAIEDVYGTLMWGYTDTGDITIS